LGRFGVILVMALTVSTCSADDANGPSPQRVTTTTERPDRTGRVTESTTTSAPKPEPPDAVFGQPFNWNDGLQVTVSPPEPLTADGSLPSDGSTSYATVVVRVMNGSDTTYEPRLSFTVSEQGAGDSTTILLTDAGGEGFPSAAVAPGGEVAFSVGFGLIEPSGLVLEVVPGVGYPAATFAR
jgi:hypothetical protein